MLVKIQNGEIISPLGKSFLDKLRHFKYHYRLKYLIWGNGEIFYQKVSSIKIKIKIYNRKILSKDFPISPSESF
jgi:hypothetical protein